MVEENKNTLLIISIVAIVAIVGLLFLFVGRRSTEAGSNENLAGQAVRQIRATSCDGDQLCEMNNAKVIGKGTFGSVEISGQTISTIQGSKNALYLKSDDGSVIVNGPLNALDHFIANKNVVVDGSLLVGINENAVLIKNRTISTSQGTRSDLVLTSDTKKVLVDDILEIPQGINIEGNRITTTVPNSFLILSSFSGSVYVRDYLRVGKDVSVANGVYIYGGNISTLSGPLYLLSNARKVILDNANLEVNLLSGPGNAYACIDKYGVLFRSSTPCV